MRRYHRRTYPLGYCRAHATSTERHEGWCVYCGAELHVHDAQLRLAVAYGVGHEPCHYCHRVNGIMPTHTRSRYRTTKLEEGKPVMQLTLDGRSHAR
jgi:hypothetical protein